MDEEERDIGAIFEKYTDDFLKFEDIPKGERWHSRPDLCAMLYLHEKYGGDGDAVSASEHDIAYLDWRPDILSDEDVLYLTRCGIHYEDDALCMFT